MPWMACRPWRARNPAYRFAAPAERSSRPSSRCCTIASPRAVTAPRWSFSSQLGPSQLGLSQPAGASFDEKLAAIATSYDGRIVSGDSCPRRRSSAEDGAGLQHDLNPCGIVEDGGDENDRRSGGGRGKLGRAGVGSMGGYRSPRDKVRPSEGGVPARG